MSFLANTRKCKVLSVQPIKSHSSLANNDWYTLVSVQLLEVLAHAICATQTTDLLVLSKCKNWWENRSDYSRPQPISFRPTDRSSWVPTAWQKVLNSGHDSDNIIFRVVIWTAAIWPDFGDLDVRASYTVLQASWRIDWMRWLAMKKNASRWRLWMQLALAGICERKIKERSEETEWEVPLHRGLHNLAGQRRGPYNVKASRVYWRGEGRLRQASSWVGLWTNVATGAILDKSFPSGRCERLTWYALVLEVSGL